MALTTAYAGHADITGENAAAILNQYLPEDPPKGVGLGLVLIPERVPRLQKGLKATIAWLESEVGADGTIPVEDLIAAMLERKEKTGDDLELYLLFDPENEDDLALAKAAHEAGIPIRNLAAAGDFLEVDEPEDETPPWEEPTPAEAAAAEAEAAIPGATEERLAAAARHAVPTGIAQAQVLDMNLTLGGLVKLLAREIVAEMASLGAQQVAAVAAAPVPSARTIEDKPAEPTGRSEQVPGSAAFYYNAEKGTYRKARGIARDGETKVFLTDDEQAEARANKLLV